MPEPTTPELGCSQCRELTSELALDALTGVARAQALAHLERCADCRERLCALTVTADRLIELLPEAQPPAGFEQRVIAALTPPLATRRWWQPSAAVLLAFALAAGGGWTLARATHGTAPAQTTTRPGERTVMFASLTAGERPGTGAEVGQAYLYPGPSAWLYLSLDMERYPISGTVHCELVRHDGSSVPIGAFPPVKSYAHWGVPLPATADRGSFTMARVIDSGGHTLATAHFASPATISAQPTTPVHDAPYRVNSSDPVNPHRVAGRHRHRPR